MFGQKQKEKRLMWLLFFKLASWHGGNVPKQTYQRTPGPVPCFSWQSCLLVAEQVFNRCSSAGNLWCVNGRIVLPVWTLGHIHTFANCLGMCEGSFQEGIMGWPAVWQGFLDSFSGIWTRPFIFIRRRLQTEREWLKEFGFSVLIHCPVIE